METGKGKIKMSSSTPENRSNVIKFCVSYLLSAFGYEFIFFVMTVYVYDLTGSALNVGIFAALTFVPKLFSPFFGSITDRYPRNKIFSVSTGIVSVLILLISFFNNIKIVYAIWFFVAIAVTVIMNVRTAIMTEVMPKDNYLRGNSTVLISLNATKIVAPLLGGIIAAKWDPRLLLLLTSFVYLVATVFGGRIEVQWHGEIGTAAKRNTVLHIREGIQYLLSNNTLTYLAAIVFCWRLFLGLQVSLFVVYVKSFLSRGDTAFGIFMAVVGVGSIVGSIAGPGLVNKLGNRRIVNWGLGGHYLLFALLGFIRSYELAVATVFFCYLLLYASVVGFHSLRDMATSLALRGRVYGSITAIVTPPALISMLLGGYLAGTYGVEKVLAVSGVLAAVSLQAIRFAFSNGRSPVFQAR